jgi:hypothetical protein
MNKSLGQREGQRGIFIITSLAENCPAPNDSRNSTAGRRLFLTAEHWHFVKPTSVNPHNSPGRWVFFIPIFIFEEIKALKNFIISHWLSYCLDTGLTENIVTAEIAKNNRSSHKLLPITVCTRDFGGRKLWLKQYPNNAEVLIILIWGFNHSSKCFVVGGNKKGLSRKYQSPNSGIGVSWTDTRVVLLLMFFPLFLFILQDPSPLWRLPQQPMWSPALTPCSMIPLYTLLHLSYSLSFVTFYFWNYIPRWLEHLETSTFIS